MLDQPIVGQLALRPEYMSDAERLNEIGEILARKESGPSAASIWVNQSEPTSTPGTSLSQSPPRQR